MMYPYHGPKRLPILDKIVPKLKKNPESGCIEWQGCVREGYGVTSHGRGNVVYAHRVMYESAIGPIPSGLCVLHRCDNRRCCNPIHLFLGTRADNARDRERKLRGMYGEAVPWSKLTVKDVREILKLHKEGASVRSLQEKYGVSRATIEDAIKGETWRKAMQLEGIAS